MSEEANPAGEPTPESEAPRVTADEALRRARAHAGLAAREALTALRWLLEAGSLAATGTPSEQQRWIGALARFLDSAAAGFESEDVDVGSRLLESVAEALDREIARWEERSRSEPEARPVLRAFLGLREILWEFGLRPATAPREDTGASPRPRSRRAGRRHAPAPPPIERVPVEG